MAPELKGSIKLRKRDRMIRPPVNCLQAPTYNTTKHLTLYLKQNYNFKTAYNVKNSRYRTKWQIQNSDHQRKWLTGILEHYRHVWKNTKWPNHKSTKKRQFQQTTEQTQLHLYRKLNQNDPRQNNKYFRNRQPAHYYHRSRQNSL